MSEKRSHERKNLHTYIETFDRETGQMIGYVADITPDGIMLLVEEPIKLDRKFQLKLVLPTHISEGKQIHFNAKSVRCVKDGTLSFYNAGFSVNDLDSGSQELIHHLIQEHVFHEFPNQEEL